MPDSATNTNSEPLTSKVLSPVIYKHTKGTLTLSPKSLTFVASNNEEEDLEVDWTWRSFKTTKTHSRKKLHQITLVLKDTSHSTKDKEPKLLFPTATAMQDAQTDLQHNLTRANQAVAKRQTKQHVLELEKKAREGKNEMYSQSVAGPPPQHVNSDDAPQYDEHMAQSTCLRCFHCCCRMFVAGRSS